MDPVYRIKVHIESNIFKITQKIVYGLDFVEEKTKNGLNNEPEVIAKLVEISNNRAKVESLNKALIFIRENES